MTIPNTVKSRAHDLVARTGIKYTDALTTVDRADPPRQPRHRWVLTDELRGWLHGEGWRGCYYPDLWELVDNLRPAFECDHCYDDADARREDCSVRFLISRYDPDLHPQTMHIGTHKYHARCKPSGLDWSTRVVGVDPGPFTVTLPASVNPEVHGTFAIDVLPHQSEDDTLPPMLILSATVTNDHGHGEAPWVNEFELFLRGNGFSELDTEPLGEFPEWTVRVSPGEAPHFSEQWIGLRTEPAKLGEFPNHLYLGAMGLKRDEQDTVLDYDGKPLREHFPEWAEQAFRWGGVLVMFGPLAVGNDVPKVDYGQLNADELDDLLTGDPDAWPEDARYIARLVRVADPADPARALTTGTAFEDA